MSVEKTGPKLAAILNIVLPGEINQSNKQFENSVLAKSNKFLLINDMKMYQLEQN